jgi:hypothetical protein
VLTLPTPLYLSLLGQYIKNEAFARVPCLNSTVGQVLQEIQRTKKRAIGKAKHREAMRRGSTIIPLYDPTDWESPLPDCLPAADNAYLDLGPYRRASCPPPPRLSLPCHGSQDRDEEEQEGLQLSDLSSDDDREDERVTEESHWVIPPRRKRRDPQERLWLSQMTPERSPHGQVSTRCEISEFQTPAPASAAGAVSGSPKKDLISPTGVVDTRAVYRSLFSQDRPISSPSRDPRTRKVTEASPPLPSPAFLSAAPSTRAAASAVVTPKTKTLCGSEKLSPPDDISPPKPVATKKPKPSVQKPQPVYLDPQVCLFPLSVSAPSSCLAVWCLSCLPYR